MTGGFTVSLADWHKDLDRLRRVREAVFILEQHVPKDLEWDAADPECTHVIAVDDKGEAIGTGRLVPDGSIGRMAVLKDWRGRGVGAAMMRMLMEEAAGQGHGRLKLSSQDHAVGFYQHYGFRVTGEPYMEAGIPHVTMVCDNF